jgi:hypothetical protein
LFRRLSMQFRRRLTGITLQDHVVA